MRHEKVKTFFRKRVVSGRGSPRGGITIGLEKRTVLTFWQ
jgi:hypothetical protein